MRRVGRLGVAIYGHAKFRDVSPDEWKSQPWLFYNDDVMDASSLRWLHSLSLQVAPRLRSSSTSILVKACKAGLGIALLPCVVADDTDLVRLSPSNVVEGDIWLLSHRDTSDIQRFRVVTDWLARQVALDKDILLGTVHD
jgi:DNA-binding transcriptional LysR family regulator